MGRPADQVSNRVNVTPSGRDFRVVPGMHHLLPQQRSSMESYTEASTVLRNCRSVPVAWDARLFCEQHADVLASGTIWLSARLVWPAYVSDACFSCGCVRRSTRSRRRCQAGCRPRLDVATRRRAGCRARSGSSGCDRMRTRVSACNVSGVGKALC